MHREQTCEQNSHTTQISTILKCQYSLQCSRVSVYHARMSNFSRPSRFSRSELQLFYTKMIDHFVLFLQPKPKTIILVCDHFSMFFFVGKNQNDHFAFFASRKKTLKPFLSDKKHVLVRKCFVPLRARCVRNTTYKLSSCALKHSNYDKFTFQKSASCSSYGVANK